MHRDVKPENIFLKLHPETGKLQAKLGDFGLATSHSHLSHQFAFDSEGLYESIDNSKSAYPVGLLTRYVGTLAYMAPEQRGACYDHKVDAYALGMVLWEMFEPASCPQERHTRLQQVRHTGTVEWQPRTKRSSLALSIIQKLVAWRPENRSSVSDILRDMRPLS